MTLASRVSLSNFVTKITLCACLAIPFPQSAFAVQAAPAADPATAPNVSNVVEQFTDKLTNLLREAHLIGGAASVVETTENLAEAHPDFAALIELVRRENNGNPVEILVKGPASMQRAVDFSNDCLRRLFGSAFVYKLEIDDSLPGVKHVRPSEQKAYSMWKRIRVGTMPMLGFATTIASFFLQHPSGTAAGIFSNLSLDNASVRALMPSLAIGAATAALESQFIYFSTWWNGWWSQQQTSFAMPLPASVRNKFANLTGILDRIRSATNWGLDRTVNPLMAAAGVSRSMVYNYLVNFGYATILYTAGFLTGELFHLSAQHFSLLTAWQNAFWGTNLFFISTGFFQIALGKMNDLSVLSEALRFKLESMASYIGGAGRVLGMVPGMQAAGYAVQAMFLMAATIPTWVYIRSLQKRASAMGQMSDPEISNLADQMTLVMQDQAAAIQILDSNCERMLSGVATPLFAHNSVSKMLGEVSKRISSGLRSRLARILGR